MYETSVDVALSGFQAKEARPGGGSEFSSPPSTRPELLKKPAFK